MNCPDLKDVALRAADRMPVLPALFQRTISLFAKGDDVSVGELAHVVEQDVVMAGNLLSIANSALYSRASSVSSVRQAIARIGIPKTRNTLLGLSVFRSFRDVGFPKNWSAARFNAHSLASAIFSDLLVQRARTENADWAFLAGLLHDIGLLLLATGLPDHSLAVADAGSDYQLVEWERRLLGFTHFEIGADLLMRWNCPAIVQDVLGFLPKQRFSVSQPAEVRDRGEDRELARGRKRDVDVWFESGFDSYPGAIGRPQHSEAGDIHGSVSRGVQRVPDVCLAEDFA